VASHTPTFLFFVDGFIFYRKYRSHSAQNERYFFAKNMAKVMKVFMGESSILVKHRYPYFVSSVP